MTYTRFIHTSDIHLDTSFSGSAFPSELGIRKREAIRTTFRRVLEEARSANVDFILIAGDLFEHERVTADTVQFLKQQFANLDGIRVFISPGNHDPYIKGSPYREESWPANVHIFNSEEFQSVDLPGQGVRITGFGFTRPFMQEHHFQKLPVLSEDFFNIVLSHASDLSCVPMGKSRHAPFTVEEIAGKNVGYCALGHYHQQRRLDNPFDAAEVWYSGIPEGRGWDEEGACGYLIGEIKNDVVKVDYRSCNQYPLCTLTVDCEGFSTREQIIDEILRQRGILFGPHTILRVRLVGSLDPRLDLYFRELEERLAGEVLYVQWEDRTQPELDFNGLAQERTLRGRFVRVLNDRLAAASEQERDILERARIYGIQALSGREVRLR